MLKHLLSMKSSMNPKSLQYIIGRLKSQRMLIKLMINEKSIVVRFTLLLLSDSNYLKSALFCII